MAISAARPMTVHVMRAFTRAVIVVWISPGSEDRRDPKMSITSRVPWAGALLNDGQNVERIKGETLLRTKGFHESSRGHSEDLADLLALALELAVRP